MMTISRFYIRLVLPFCLFLSTYSLAKPDPSANLKTTIKVVTESYPPFQFVNKQHQVDGYATEIVKQLFILTGDNADITLMPWARAYNTALQQKNVLIYSMVRNNIREQKFNWIGPVSKEKIFFWRLKTTQPVSNLTLAELKSKLVVTTKDSNMDQFMTEQQFPHLYRVTSMDQAIGMLFTHRVEILSGSVIDMQKRTKALGLDFSQLVKVYHNKKLNRPLFIAFSGDTDTVIVQRYRAAYQTLQQQKVITALRIKWHISN